MPEGVVDRIDFVDACTAIAHPCTAMNGADCGKCQYRFAVDPARCSAAAPCDDLVLLDVDPDRTCTFASVPDAPHCSTFASSLGTACLDWFETLP